MTHLLHHISIGKKFMLALALPLLAMAYFAIDGIVERQQVVSDMQRLQALTVLAQQAGGLIHEIQRERGMTAGFLGSEGRTFRSELSQQRTATDRQLTAFQDYAARLDHAYLTADLTARMETVRSQLASHAALRRRVDELSIPASQAIAQYTASNAELMNLVGELSHATRQAGVSRRLSAYYNLLEAKDLAGVERALLANAFSADQIAPASYQRFMTLIGEEAAFQKSFRALGTDTMRKRFDDVMSGADIDRLEALRALVIEKADQGGFGVDPQQWFEWQTAKIGHLKSVEDAVVAEVLATAEALGDEARLDLLVYVIVAALATSLAILLAILIVRGIVLPLKHTLEAISRRGGDLTQRLAVPGSDELSQLYQVFNLSTTDTEHLVGNIRQSALSVEVASGEIAQGNQDLAQRTEEQSASLVETASSMEQITSTVRQTADNARQAQTVSEQTVTQAREANEVAGQAREAMQRILADNERVTAIIATIDSIAFQTNLLALNASVEAARAGEEGRGFAVVATEVRQLASRSAEEAKQIRELIGHNVLSVQEGSKLVSATSDTLAAISTHIDQVTSLVSDIAAASHEQSAGIEQINQAVAQLEEVTQQNAALVEQIAAASKSLDEQAVEMTGMIGQFKVSETAVRVSGPASRSDRDAMAESGPSSRLRLTGALS
ncbi:methyl-accepting chemotaxis protein [Halomonas shantousis]